MNIIYLLAYSWIAGYCVNKNYPGCLNKSDYWKNHFTIHGLWPQYVDNGYPEFCTDEPFNSTIPDLIGMDIMTKYWPNVEYEVNNPNYDSFYNHEWTKHGTCSLVNNQFDYFNSTITDANTLKTLINRFASESLSDKLLIFQKNVAKLYTVPPTCMAIHPS